MITAHPEHGPDELCDVGTRVYQRALDEGWVTLRDVDETPCLIDMGLLGTAAGNPDRLEPVTPSIALQRLLRASEDRIADERRRGQRIADAFEPLMRAGAHAAGTNTPMLRILGSNEHTNRAITETLAAAKTETLTIQPYRPHLTRRPEVHAAAIARDQAFLDRGGRIRALYQHSVRHIAYTRDRYERLSGDVEARTLDEVTERLIIIDRTVAFIPASADRSLALEVRHPALIAYFVNTFDRLWHLATPMHPQAVHQPTLNGITPRQRAIAALLIEGHTDSDIADRLGMNVRTARVHIAKLAATLGSESRAQLGYLIGQSGILDREE
ncbi:LuxR C-terminal-related transcriptional regulator [Streptomyces sp. BRB040]|uniref:helix-turn-helix transcriptional regulator n=1 Tax=Streptomyces sp. BRB040 TaxID=3142634 RepID=UPI0031F6C098